MCKEADENTLENKFSNPNILFSGLFNHMRWIVSINIFIMIGGVESLIIQFFKGSNSFGRLNLSKIFLKTPG